MQNEALHTYISQFFGSDSPLFLQARPEPAAVRVNTLRSNASVFTGRLKTLGVPFEPVAFNPNGFIVRDDSLPLSHTLDFFCGDFQYQGISSQLPALALAPKPGERVLDMAAAPGSKSTQIAALMHNRGQLFVNDVSRPRLQALNANTQKAGVFNHVLLNLGGEQMGTLFPNFFDKVLLDAPCSALGTLPAHPEIVSWWSPEKMKRLTGVQSRLLISAFKSLKPGGELVYSTCSFTPEENEMQILAVLEKYPMEILSVSLPGSESFLRGLSAYKGLTFPQEMERAWRVLPHVHGMEGFFVIKLRKTGIHKLPNPARVASFKPTREAGHPEVRADLREISETWGVPPEVWQKFRFVRTSKRLWLTAAEVTRIPENGFTSAGLLLGEKKQFMWKLYNQAVRLLDSRITRRIFRPQSEVLRELFASGTARVPSLKNGYFALEWNHRLIGSIYVESGRAQIKLPHRFHLVL